MRRRVLLGLTLTVLSAGCGKGGDPRPTPEPRDRPLVLTTAWHLADIARALVGAAADVACAVPPDVDERNWRPDRSALERLVGADLLILGGAGLEPWAEHSNLPRGRLIDASRPFRDLWIEQPDGVVHSHGGGEQHAHLGVDPHVWLDPELLALQVRAVGDGLSRLLDEQRDEIAARTGELVDAALALRAILNRALPEGGAAILGERVLVATHPSFAYLARRLGIGVVDVSLRGDEAPPAAVALLRGALGGRQAAVLLWEAAPPAELAAALEQKLGARSVVIDTLVSRGAPQLRGDAPFAALREAYVALGAALAGG